MLGQIALLAVGCVLLYFGADWLVQGASRIASALGIPKSIVGLTLVAFGTSAPELFVNVVAGYRGETGFALSNVSGSNLTNICIGVGLCGLLGGVSVRWTAFRADCLVLFASAATVLVILFGTWDNPRIPLWSIAPLAAMATFYLLSLVRRGGTAGLDKTETLTAAGFVWNTALFVIGVACLSGGGTFVLDSAVSIAKGFNIDASLIGLTIVAAGTSIPDTIASLVAARRGEHEIAIGNLLGSNISNVLVVLGATILASWLGGRPVENPGILLASSSIMLDYAMVCAVSLVFIGLAAWRGQVGRGWGTMFVLTYFAYMAYRVSIELAG